jgi:xylulokinase
VPGGGGGGPLLLGIDAGTSRIRAIAFDLAGRPAAEGSSPTPTSRPGPGQGEHDAEEIWRAAVAAVRGALAGLDDPRRVRSVAVASMGEAGVLLDGAGRPTGPVLAWYDARPGSELDGLERRVGREALHGITGLCPDPTFTLPKLLWLRRHRPDAFAAARAWLGVGGWIAWRLCGERATDHSIASRTMLLDLAAGGRWSDELLGAAGLPDSLLGPLAPSGAPLGRLLPEAAAATGLPEDCVVGVGGHDHICGLLALGADEPGVLLNSLGTAEALLLVAPEPSRERALLDAGINQGLVGVAGRGPPLTYLFGGLPTSAACVEWFRSLWPGVDHATLVAEAEAVPPGAHEVMFLPQLRLGSPPHPDPVARGAFVGVSDACGRGVLFRALLEGMALDSANQLRLMRAHAGPLGVTRVVATGGGTRNPLLLRLKASLFGLPVEAADSPEGTCLGAALLGGLAAGLFPDLGAARAGLAGGRRPAAAPDPAWPAAARERRLAAYGRAYARVRELNALLREAAGPPEPAPAA